MEQGRDLTAESARTGLLFCEQPHWVARTVLFEICFEMFGGMLGTAVSASAGGDC